MFSVQFWKLYVYFCLNLQMPGFKMFCGVSVLLHHHSAPPTVALFDWNSSYFYFLTPFFFVKICYFRQLI